MAFTRVGGKKKDDSQNKWGIDDRSLAKIAKLLSGGNAFSSLLSSTPISEPQHPPNKANADVLRTYSCLVNAVDYNMSFDSFRSYAVCTSLLLIRCSLLKCLRAGSRHVIDSAFWATSSKIALQMLSLH